MTNTTALPHAGLASWRLRAYRWLSGLLRFRSYTVKVFLLAFATTHIPLLALVAYILLVADMPAGTIWRIILVTLTATLIGTALALGGLSVMLAPVTAASHALAAYRQDGSRPRLPTDIDDEGGQLLADVQHTLVELDDILTQTRDIAARDSLTGLFNRREAERLLHGDLAVAQESGQPFGLLASDADGLKAVNDRWGHAAGDAYIRHVSAVISQEVGTEGWVARWGGDEFLVRCVDAESASALLTRINTSLAARPLHVSCDDVVVCRVTGGAATSMSGDDTGDLIARADTMLYRMKRAGAEA